MKILKSHFDKGGGYSILMTYITDEEISNLKEFDAIELQRNNFKFPIKLDDCLFLRTNVDFSTNSENYNAVKTIEIFSNKDNKGIDIPCHYDYKTHSVSEEITEYCYKPKVKYVNSFNLAKIVQYIHGCLGKPKNVVIAIC